MNNKKPDALVILAVLFVAGVLISAISHGGGEDRNKALAGFQSQAMPGFNR